MMRTRRRGEENPVERPVYRQKVAALRMPFYCLTYLRAFPCQPSFRYFISRKLMRIVEPLANDEQTATRYRQTSVHGPIRTIVLIPHRPCVI